ncbi:TIGR04255 family protein [Nocardiopsis sp. NPDC050513]|uniref:TIGR04255 family protein n=1 Tax=Nocardiopsis sp. NPDC050513 TaxID=3364338 RepID=UPI003797B48A
MENFEGRDISFSHPPVRQVVLTALFEPIDRMNSLDFGLLRLKWENQYPVLSETAPLPPWQADERGGFGFVGTDDSWPIPYCDFSNQEETRSIQFQSDRFILAWKFQNSGLDYPGFFGLLSDMEERFSEFCDIVQNSGKDFPKVEKVMVNYVNIVDAIGADEFTYGALSGWKEPYERVIRDYDYFGVRARYRGGSLGIPVSVGLDSVPNPSNSETESALISFDSEKDVKDGQVWRDEITELHDGVLKVFLEVMPESLRNSWE